MRQILCILLTVIASIPVFPGSINRSDIPEIKAVRTDTLIAIDGKLSESIWKREGYTQLVQRDPIEGAQPTEETSVMLAYNDNGLYVAGICNHTGKDSIAGGLSRRDEFVESDWFWIDPNCDRQNGFGFAVNPDGSIIDQKLYQDIWTDQDWDGVWESAAKKNGDSWTFEMYIPFSQLRFNKKDNYVWGCNFKRYVLANAEHDYFVMVPKQESGFVSRFGRLTGLEGISPPARLFISPYAMGKVNDFPDLKKSVFRKDQRFGKDIGLDVKVGLTGNLTLDLAVNPDFGQAEVDPAVINLSAFETYYSEKRAFFLEGSDIFYFGSNPAGSLWGCYWSDPGIFYSRRIGRQPSASPSHEGDADVPDQTMILGAAKVSGRIGKWSIGSINALTRGETARVDSAGVRFEETVEPPAYYGVYRGIREFQEGERGLGFMVTGLMRGQDGSRLTSLNNNKAFVAGLDGWSFFGKNRDWGFIGRLAWSTVYGTEERITLLQASSVHYYQRPDFESQTLDSSRTSLSGMMGRFGFGKRTGNVMFQTAFGFITPGFDVNDLGYLRYGNVINSHVVLGYRWLKPTSWYRTIYLNVMTSRNFDFDGNRLFSQYYGSWSIQLLNYLSLFGSFQITPDGLDLYKTRGGPIMAYPAYVFSMFGLSTDERKNIQAGGEAAWNNINDGGYEYYAQVYVTLKATSSLRLTVAGDYDQSFTHSQWVANVADPEAVYGYHYVFSDLHFKNLSSTLRMDWGITPKLSLQCYIQPYFAVGRYAGFKELAKACTYDYHPYILNAFNPDFNFKSFKANFVLRWEYLPGSLLYLVWTHDRDNYDRPGVFNLQRDLSTLMRENSNNIFFVKVSYMISVY